jgi:hypothetical protein
MTAETNRTVQAGCQTKTPGAGSHELPGHHLLIERARFAVLPAVAEAGHG